MRKIFTIYWAWFVVTLLIMINVSNVPFWVIKLVMASSILSFCFICIAPIFVIIHPTIIKSHKTDPQFLNLCLFTGIIRAFVWFFIFMGLDNHILVLAINSFCILMYAFVENKTKRISDEYFKD